MTEFYGLFCCRNYRLLFGLCGRSVRRGVCHFAHRCADDRFFAYHQIPHAGANRKGGGTQVELAVCLEKFGVFHQKFTKIVCDHPFAFIAFKI